MNKIWYEGKFRKVDEIESDHIHLDDGTVIRNHEIIKFPLDVFISKYSKKRDLKKLLKGLKKTTNKIDKMLGNILKK